METDMVVLNYDFVLNRMGMKGKRFFVFQAAPLLLPLFLLMRHFLAGTQLIIF